MKKLITLGAGLLIMQLMLGCQASSGMKEEGAVSENINNESEKMNIAKIINDARKYEGTMVTLSGLFAGWSGKCLGSPPKTRSDWMLESDGVCIYVSGPFPTGTSARPPAKGIGLNVKVSGTVFIDENSKPYIEIESF